MKSLKKLDRLQQDLFYQFSNIQLLERALTHRSFCADHFERLEFLGDAVLEAAISSLLYEQLPTLPEGDLSRVRANLVRQESLHKVAIDLHLSDYLRLGEGEIRSGGRIRASILADTLESIVGAIYLDGGFDKILPIISRWFSGSIKSGDTVQQKDAKTMLQEWLQARKLGLPSYMIVATKGAAHEQQFEVMCTVASLNLQRAGLGSSRRIAEQAAARAVLDNIEILKIH